MSTFIPAMTQKVLDLAKSQVGYHEGKSAGHWNNIQKFSEQVPGLSWSDGQPWCNTFVSWVDWKLGLGIFPHTASTDAAMAWFAKAGHLHGKKFPAIGAQIFFGTGSNPNHTGIVVDFDATHVWTVEGNSNTNGSREGDGVYLQKRLRTQASIIGYGYPKYVGGIVSADSSIAKPKAPPAPTPTNTDQALGQLQIALPAIRSSKAFLAAGLAATQPGATRHERIQAAYDATDAAHKSAIVARDTLKEL